MKRLKLTLNIFLKTVCVMTALLLFASPFVTCFAAAVKVPVFTAVPERVETVAGNGVRLEFSSKIFGDTKTQIEYSLEVLKFGRFCRSGQVSDGISGEVAVLDLQTGKGSVLFLNHGVYTARIKASSLDSEGNVIASAFSPAFEIEILAPIVKDITADARIFYGGEFQISAEINSVYEDASRISFQWMVSDGGSFRVLTEGEVINGVRFIGTSSAVLKLQGKPQEIFSLDFSVVAKVKNSIESVPVGDLTVEFRNQRVKGFSPEGDGVRFYYLDGNYAVGWLRYENRVYYLDPENGFVVTGSKVIDGKKCLFGADGRLLEGFYKTPLGYRYFANGGSVEGWYEVDGQICYFDPYTGYMTAKKDAVTGNTVYFSDYGSRQSRLSESN